jgi:hypothetical protein
MKLEMRLIRQHTAPYYTKGEVYTAFKTEDHDWRVRNNGGKPEACQASMWKTEYWKPVTPTMVSMRRASHGHPYYRKDEVYDFERIGVSKWNLKTKDGHTEIRTTAQLDNTEHWISTTTDTVIGEYTRVEKW